MNIPRRTFLKNALATGGALALSTTFWPPAVLADWPKVAFEAKTIDAALKSLFDNPAITESDKITITTPTVAENGALVPVEVAVDLPKVESITIMAEKNPAPLVGQFIFPDPDNAIGWVKTRIKMSGTSHVLTVVKADGKFYKARREVKVTVGGCGQVTS